MKMLRKLVAGIMSVAIVMTCAVGMSSSPAMAASKEVTVYFQNTKNWTNVYAYLWAGSGNIKGTPSWPGQKMTKVSGTDNWYEAKYTAGTAFNVIFNDNNQPKPNQTANHTPKDLAADRDAYWFVPTSESQGNSNGYTPNGTVIKVYTEAQSGFPTPAKPAEEKKTQPTAAPAADKKDASPKTGDTTGNAPVVVTAVALLALAGMGTMIRRKARA